MASGPDGVRPPAPPAEAVRASRVHAAARFAGGVDRFMWETYRRPLADTDAVEKVVEAAEAGTAEGPDLAAALLLVQSALLDLDRLAWRVMQAVAREGMSDETVAAVLDLPSAEAAREYAEWLARRAALPVDSVSVPAPGLGKDIPGAETKGPDIGADARSPGTHAQSPRDARSPRRDARSPKTDARGARTDGDGVRTDADGLRADGRSTQDGLSGRSGRGQRDGASARDGRGQRDGRGERSSRGGLGGRRTPQGLRGDAPDLGAKATGPGTESPRPRAGSRRLASGGEPEFGVR